MKILKKLIYLSLILPVLLVCLFACNEETEYFEGITYFEGRVTDSDKNAEALSIRDGATAIAAYAFRDAKNLKSLEIPDSIISIEANAFSGCEALLTLEGGVYYVDGWAIGFKDGEEKISLREDTRGIANDAFSGCGTLTEFSIPDSVKSIGQYAFFDCGSLESISLPFIGANESTAVDDFFAYIFGAHTAADSKNYIPESLKSVTVRGGKISDMAFYECEKIESIAIFSEAEEIGKSAFEGCLALNSLIIPDSVKVIKERAFSALSSLESLKLPSALTEIGQYSFAACISLDGIVFPDGLTKIGAYAFSSCDSLTEAIIPEKTEAIGSYAFLACNALTKAKLNASSLGAGAFMNCGMLSELTLGEKLAEIPEKAFYACVSLKPCDIPDAVEKIGTDAFYGCSSATRYVFGLYYVDTWVVNASSAVKTALIEKETVGISDGATSLAVNLTVICYEGKKEDFPSIKIGKDNKLIATAKFCYYSETAPTEKGSFWYYDEDGKVTLYQ